MKFDKIVRQVIRENSEAGNTSLDRLEQEFVDASRTCQDREFVERMLAAINADRVSKGKSEITLPEPILSTSERKPTRDIGPSADRPMTKPVSPYFGPY